MANTELYKEWSTHPRSRTEYKANTELYKEWSTHKRSRTEYGWLILNCAKNGALTKGQELSMGG